jgi:hypothetical protein
MNNSYTCFLDKFETFSACERQWISSKRGGFFIAWFEIYVNILQRSLKLGFSLRKYSYLLPE